MSFGYLLWGKYITYYTIEAKKNILSVYLADHNFNDFPLPSWLPFLEEKRKEKGKKKRSSEVIFMSAYCLMRMEKVKTMSELNARMEHNYRLRKVPHADKEREHLNKELIKIETENYNTEFERLTKKYGCKIRKDSVRGIEVLCSYSARNVGKDFD